MNDSHCSGIQVLLGNCNSGSVAVDVETRIPMEETVTNESLSGRFDVGLNRIELELSIDLQFGGAVLDNVLAFSLDTDDRCLGREG